MKKTKKTKKPKPTKPLKSISNMELSGTKEDTFPLKLRADKKYTCYQRCQINLFSKSWIVWHETEIKVITIGKKRIN